LREEEEEEEERRLSFVTTHRKVWARDGGARGSIFAKRFEVPKKGIAI
jgi:hypothetical protein